MAKAVDIMPDGTLVVKTRHYEDVKRVFVVKGTNGTLFYADERPKGKWIIDGHHIRCDNCGEYMCNTDREGDTIPTNFCPNCGADMRGEQE